MLAALPVIFCPPCPPPPCSGWGKPVHRPSSQPKNVSDMLPATFLSFNCWTVPMSITAPWYINARHGVKLVKETSQTSKTAKVISQATEKHHWRLAPAYWTFWTPISMDRFHNLPTKRWSIIQNKMNEEVSHSSPQSLPAKKSLRIVFVLPHVTDVAKIYEWTLLIFTYVYMVTITVLEQCGPPCEKHVYKPHEL